MKESDLTDGDVERDNIQLLGVPKFFPEGNLDRRPDALQTTWHTVGMDPDVPRSRCSVVEDNAEIVDGHYLASHGLEHEFNQMR